MSAAAQSDLPLEQLPQPWRPNPGKGGCRRDLKAGPGTCGWWWDSCSKAEQRGCFVLWVRQMKARGLTPEDMAKVMGMAV